MFLEKCHERFNHYHTILCVGLDPVVEKIPVKKDSIEKTISFYFCEILDHFAQKIYVIKPNIAFYEQYGYEGYLALKSIIKKAKTLQIPIILDAKRGDIGNTAVAYAKAAFEDLEADAVTLSPYLGEDSLTPFFKYQDKGFFVLARTSNPGSADFQLVKDQEGNPLYKTVVQRIGEWNQKYSQNIGAVAGATHQDELREIAVTAQKYNSFPLLIPGVGSQGADFNEVVALLKKINYPLFKLFINSSSKITYSHQDHKNLSYLDAVSVEIEKNQLK